MQEEFSQKFEYEEAFSPMNQFQIKKIFEIKPFGYDISFTNASLVMMIAALICFILIKFSIKKDSKISKMQLLIEKIYLFAENITINSIGINGKKYTPLILTLIMYISVLNLLGIFMFSPTSHIAMTIPMGMIVFAVCIFISVKVHGFKYFTIFIPKDAPTAIKPLMLIIEFVSYVSRPFSLGLRLAANIIAGHVMIAVVASFVQEMGVYGILPILFIIAFSMFECCICLLQAYVFSLLSSNYIAEAKHH
ncbi:F0F1 ATP synthase subunit A [Candidatus Deianiraea vastatrix]|uniref:ATP synthase subunit a n=1 Tax=Candidatus Deianiraea vastatrix TaxID=2163644 RepID=A0A5B8XDQ7_9RICK|nr:F0F1 ATP synthase subunit A [Candidatus Deianiraea vastatrix]QED23489.1 ATP synthase subunit a [Candidatus Deianiraea vastatrix]